MYGKKTHKELKQGVGKRSYHQGQSQYKCRWYWFYFFDENYEIKSDVYNQRAGEI